MHALEFANSVAEELLVIAPRPQKLSGNVLRKFVDILVVGNQHNAAENVGKTRHVPDLKQTREHEINLDVNQLDEDGDSVAFCGRCHSNGGDVALFHK